MQLPGRQLLSKKSLRPRPLSLGLPSPRPLALCRRAQQSTAEHNNGDTIAAEAEMSPSANEVAADAASPPADEPADDLKAYLKALPNSTQFSFCDRYHEKLVDAQITTGQQLQVISQLVPEDLKQTLSLGKKDLVYAIFERALASQREEEAKLRT